MKQKESYNHQRKLVFQTIESVNNPNSIHGIYPYRGKISAIDAAAIIGQLPKGATLLDPFCGSGTIVYEAQKHGMRAFGTDMNPLAIDLARAKIQIPESADSMTEECSRIIERAKENLPMADISYIEEGVRELFHEDSLKEIVSAGQLTDSMSPYVKGCYYGAVALTARGCNDYKWTSSTVGKNIQPKRYICFYEKFAGKVKKHRHFNYGCSPAEIIKGDARKLSRLLPEKSIDFIVTSPPYFDALDYTAYYGRLIYAVLQQDRQEIRKNLIQNVQSYEEDMKQVLAEIEKITTEDAIIVFVVGDKKSKQGIINGGGFFAGLHTRKPAYIVERSYTGTSSQVFDVLNNTQRKEQIVVWDKSIKEEG